MPHHICQMKKKVFNEIVEELYEIYSPLVSPLRSGLEGYIDILCRNNYKTKGFDLIKTRALAAQIIEAYSDTQIANFDKKVAEAINYLVKMFGIQHKENIEFLFNLIGGALIKRFPLFNERLPMIISYTIRYITAFNSETRKIKYIQSYTKTIQNEIAEEYPKYTVSKIVRRCEMTMECKNVFCANQGME